MGKTSVASKLNLPGRIGWLTMEAPGFITLLYIMNTLSDKMGIEDLPWQNKVLAGLFVRPLKRLLTVSKSLYCERLTTGQVVHYSYRAIIFPLIAPSMSPIHVIVWASAISFQLMNATSLASWLAAYGPVTSEAWDASATPSVAQFSLGLLVFYIGLAANFFHDDELREIRRREQQRQEKAFTDQKARGVSKPSVEKIYKIPQAGLFKYILYPHYFCEWIEWTGFLIACGFGCVPARTFVVNEIVSMLPRAVRGRRWYEERFGRTKIGKRWTVFPGIV